jgi:hypothetical protein
MRHATASHARACICAQDPLEQRKQLQETVGTGEGPSAIANFEGNATLDNPNDSTRPADRSKQQQPLVSAGDKQVLSPAIVHLWWIA